MGKWDFPKLNELPWIQDPKTYPKLPTVPNPGYTPAGYPDVIDWETLEEIKRKTNEAMKEAKAKKMAAYYEKLVATAKKEKEEAEAKAAKAKKARAKKRKARKKKAVPPPVHDDNLYEREV